LKFNKKFKILSKIISFALMASIMLTLSFSSVLTVNADPPLFSGGSGTKSDPYLISSVDDLAMLASDINNNYNSLYISKYFLLTQDLNLTDYLNAQGNNEGKGWRPIGNQIFYFRGNFDGGGHVIRGLWSNRPLQDNVGLFSKTNGDTLICNLGVELAAAGIIGKDTVGALVADNLATIDNCYVTGNVTGIEDVGGISGGNTKAITASYFNGNVTGTRNIGGIAGFFNVGKVENCYVTGGKVTCSLKIAGGLLGDVSTGTLVKNCYSNAQVIGHILEKHELEPGEKEGEDISGGLIGSKTFGTVTSSFYNREKSGKSDTNKGTPLSDADMRLKNTFTEVGWDFKNCWGMYTASNGNTGYGYPYLPNIGNDILVTPDASSKIYDGKAAPTPPTWTAGPNYLTAYKLSGSLSYRTTPLNTGTFDVLQGTLNLTNIHYQISFKDDVVYTVEKRPLSSSMISSVPDQYFNGNPIEPAFTVTYGEPNLIKDSDYTVSFKNNTSVGIATLTITAKANRNFSETASIDFKIRRLMGDINFDGVVNSADLILIKKDLLSISKLDLDSNKMLSADMDNDKKITVTDLVMLQKFILNFNKEVSGDANFDGIINAKDLVLIKSDILSLTTLNSMEFLASDLDNDGKITVTDLVILQKRILSL